MYITSHFCQYILHTWPFILIQLNCRPTSRYVCYQYCPAYFFVHDNTALHKICSQTDLAHTSHTHRTDPNLPPKMLSYYRGSAWMAESNRFHGNTCSKNQLPPLQRLKHLKAAEAVREKRRKWENTLSPLLMAKPFTRHYFHARFLRKPPAHQTKHKDRTDFSSVWQRILPHSQICSPFWVKLWLSWWCPKTDMTVLEMTWG